MHERRPIKASAPIGALLLLLVVAGIARGDPADEALATFRAGHDLAPLVERTARPWMVVDQLLLRREYDAAEAFAAQVSESLLAYAVATRAHGPNARAAVLRDAMQADSRKGDFAGALASFSEFGGLGEDWVSAHVLYIAGRCQSALGRPEEGELQFRAAGDLAARLGDPDLAGEAFSKAIWAALSRKATDRAFETWERWAPLARASGPGHETWLLLNLCLIHEARGEWEELLAVATRAETCGRIPSQVRWARINAAVALERLRRRDEAAAKLAEVLVADDGPLPRADVENRLFTLWREADPERAWEHYRRSAELFAEGGDLEQARERYLYLAPRAAAREDKERAAADYREIARLAGELGDPLEGSYLNQAGVHLLESKRFAEAEEVLRRAASISAELVHRINALGNLGTALGGQGRWAEGQAAHEEAVRRAREADDPPTLAAHLILLARSLCREGHYEETIRRLDEAADLPGGELAPKLGDQARRLWGESLWMHGSSEPAVQVLERALDGVRSRRDSAAERRVLSELAIALAQCGRLEEAEQRARESVAIAETERERVYSSAGLAHALMFQGRYEEALEHYRGGREFFDREGDERMQVVSRTEEAGLLLGLGRPRRALELLLEARRLTEEAELDPPAALFGNLAVAYQRFGRQAEAVACLDRALEIAHRKGYARGEILTLQQRAVTNAIMGDTTLAEQDARAAVELARDRGLSEQLPPALISHARTLQYAGRTEEARERCLEALEVARLQKRPTLAAQALVARGRIELGLDDAAAALPWFEQASGTLENFWPLSLTAWALAWLDRTDEAREYLDRARELARKEDPGDQAQVHQCAALVHLRAGEYDAAVRSARLATETAARNRSGLDERRSAYMGDYLSTVFHIGLVAAARADRAEDALYFLEANRARGLLEALGGRDAVRHAALPPEQEDAVATAQARESGARKWLAAARRSGRRAELRRAREKLREAERLRAAAVSRLRSQARLAAGVTEFEPARPAEVQSILAEDEVLVVYGLNRDGEGAAVVLTRESLRVVPLDAPGIEVDPGRGADVEGLRRLLVEPLELDRPRVLLSPGGQALRVPFVQLLPEQTVSYVPSATVLTLLRSGERERGEGVLALGDPDYEGRGLAPLPASRAEAEAVGTKTLLGEDATRERLAASLCERRWRAIHLACHGRIDLEYPVRSALELTDGPLAVLDVFQLKAPADLAVLSACETAAGPILAGDGVLGFVQAFMVAGAPRVIVSLWKVDDEATAALMKRFYELWRSGETDAATALKRAQAFVASHDQWQHPRFWAAWQLWGLPR